MKPAIRFLLLVVLVATSASCNQRTSFFEPPSSPTASPGLPAPRPGVYSILFQPGASLGGGPVQGKVLLTFAAPDGGLEVSLANSDPALLSLPSTVVVPAGRDAIEFPAIAQAVSADRDVVVAASSAVGRQVTATFPLWATLPTFFSFWSDQGDHVGQGGFHRLTPPMIGLSAVCSGSEIRLRFTAQSGSWSATFQAPRGTPVRVGTYEGATQLTYGSHPGLDISGSRSCYQHTGRFTVREADFTAAGQVRQFWATFEQYCSGSTAGLHGDVRVTNGPAPGYNANCLR